MPVTTQPPAIQSAYQPLRYRAFENSILPLEKCRVEVLRASDNAVLSAWWIDLLQSVGNAYSFETDVSDYIRGALIPLPSEKSACFLDFTETSGNMPLHSLTYRIRFSFWRRNSQNLLENSNLTVTSADTTAVAIILQNEDEQELTEFLDTVSRKMLTLKPRRLEISLLEYYAACYIISNQVDTGRVSWVNMGGGTDFAYFAATAQDSTTLNNKGIHCVGVGPQNFLARGPAEWLHGPDPFEPGETTRSYTVEFGNYLGGLFTPVTEGITFDMVPKCDGIRLWWLNSLGGADAFTFDGRRIESSVSRSEIGQRAAAWSGASTYKSEQKSRYKTRVLAEPVFIVESRLLSYEQALWASGVGDSPEVYEERDGRFIPVLIRDVENEIYNSEDAGSVIRFVVEYSHPRTRHTH
jgi:hypothetical protein